MPLVDEGLAGAPFVGSCLPVPLPLEPVSPDWVPLLAGCDALDLSLPAALPPLLLFAFPDWVPLLAGLFAAEVEGAALPS